MKKIQRNISFLIFPILLLASVLRLFRLDSIPPSPYWEEVALGYDAYSIAQTGKDHHGNPYPLIAFPSYGDYKPSGYFYAIVPFVKLLGLNVLAVRLPSAIAGSISVGLLYLIGKELFDEKTGLIAAAGLTIQPWAIQFSRGGWEVNFAMMLILLGTTLLLYARRKPWLLLLSVFFFCLSMYTYHAARLFAPLVGGLGGIIIVGNWLRMSFLRRQESRQKSKSRDTGSRIRLLVAAFTGMTTSETISLLLSVFLVFLFLFPLLSNLNNKSVSSRFSDTSIFSNPQPVLDSNAAIAAHGNTRIARLLYHRYWYYGAIVVKQWASHFSPEFLFAHGDGNYRHGGWIYLLYPIEGIFILLAIFSVLKAKSYQLPAILLWIALAAIPPALVTPAPHALRFLFAAPAFSLLVACGIVFALQRVPKRLQKPYLLGISAVFLFFFCSYYSQYLTIYPVQAASDWQYGYKELYIELAKLKKPNEQAYVSRQLGRPAMYYLFYSNYDPRQLQKIEPTLPKDQLELLQVDDYHFVDAIPNGTGLFALTANQIVVGGKILENVEAPDGSIVWRLWRK